MVSFCIIPFVWGLAEAVFFFIVPDVWLTWLAFTNGEWQKLTSAIIWATAGALIGGILMYNAGRYVPYQRIAEWLVHVPGISRQLIDTVALQMKEFGIWGVFEGVLKAIPYKIYAVQWGANGGNFWVWVMATIAARGGRFFLSVLIARMMDAFCQKVIQGWILIKKYVFFSFWTIFYILYFIYRSQGLPR